MESRPKKEKKIVLKNIIKLDEYKVKEAVKKIFEENEIDLVIEKFTIMLRPIENIEEEDED